MKIRINLPNHFLDIPVEYNATMSDVLNVVLNAKDIPNNYTPFCAILVIRKDGFAHVLKSE